MSDFEVEMDDMEANDISDFNLNYSEDEDINYPHIKVKKSEFKKFLKVSKNIISKSASDPVTKSILLFVEDDVLKMKATDLDVYIEYEITIRNRDNMLNDSIAIPLEVIDKLIKAVTDDVIIYKKDNMYYISLIGGDMVLETNEVNNNDYCYEGKEIKIDEVDGEDLYNVVNDFNSLVSSAVSPKEQRIFLYKDSAYASYMWAGVKSYEGFSKMNLQLKDIKVLKKLLKGVDNDLRVYDLKGEELDRKIIENDNFRYVFMTSEIDVPKNIKDSINFGNDSGIYVDYNYINKLVNVASDLPYTTGKIRVNYKDNSLILVIETMTDVDSVFKIDGAISESLDSLEDDVIVEAEYLKLLLKVLSRFSSIKVCVTENGIGLDCDEYRAVLGSEV